LADWPESALSIHTKTPGQRLQRLKRPKALGLRLWHWQRSGYLKGPMRREGYCVEEFVEEK